MERLPSVPEHKQEFARCVERLGHNDLALVRIACSRQAVRIAELLLEMGEADHFEIANDLQTEPENIHVKEFRVNGEVHNYFVDGEGNAPIKGGVGMWFVVSARKS